MAVHKYPQEVHEFVKKYAPELRDVELAEACNAELGTHFTEKSIKAFRGNHGYRNYMGRWTSADYWKYQTKWPQGMYEFIRDNSWGVSSAEMAEMVNERFGTHFTPQRMKCFRAQRGIRSGVTGWYRKGRPPANKGRRQSEFCTPEKLKASRATQYQKGHRPVNELPVGTIVTGKGGYLIRKKAMEGGQWGRWEFLHRAVWEEHNGTIPDGMCIVFKDGNKQNCDIDNLMIVSRAEMVTLNKKGYVFDNPDLTETALYVVRLQQRANRRKKGVKKDV